MEDKNLIKIGGVEHLAFIKSLDGLVLCVEKFISTAKPALDGERFITDKELSEILKLGRRTLQEYRDKGILPCYQICGKILYKESEIQELLEKCYVISRN